MLFFNFKMFILKPLKLFMVKKQGENEVFRAIKRGLGRLFPLQRYTLHVTFL